MSIYTKRGDKGETSLYEEGNTQRIRVAKDSLKVEVLGEIDELNSFLGIIKAQTKDKDLNQVLKKIQENLLRIGSIIAGARLNFLSTNTKNLERLIDDLEKSLPVLKNFLIPGGSLDASHLQYARAITRRVERKVLALAKEEKVKPQILSYLNRLSDALFMLARNANKKLGIEDEVWKKK